MAAQDGDALIFPDEPGDEYRTVMHPWLFPQDSNSVTGIGPSATPPARALAPVVAPVVAPVLAPVQAPAQVQAQAPHMPNWPQILGEFNPNPGLLTQASRQEELHHRYAYALPAPASPYAASYATPRTPSVFDQEHVAREPQAEMPPFDWTSEVSGYLPGNSVARASSQDDAPLLGEAAHDSSADKPTPLESVLGFGVTPNYRRPGQVQSSEPANKVRVIGRPAADRTTLEGDARAWAAARDKLRAKGPVVAAIEARYAAGIADVDAKIAQLDKAHPAYHMLLEAFNTEKQTLGHIRDAELRPIKRKYPGRK